MTGPRPRKDPGPIKRPAATGGRAATLFAVVVLIASPAALRGQPAALPDSVTAERIVEGAALFGQGSCTFCHAPGGRGEGRNGPDLSDEAWLHSDGDFEGIFHTLWWGVERDEMKADPPYRFEMHPRGGMPWTRAQTSAVAAYVWAISRPDAHPLVMAQAEILAAARAGRTEEALELRRAAAERWPGTPLLGERGIAGLAAERLEAGAPEEAIRWLELNLELHPESEDARRRLDEARERIGREQ